MYSDLGIALPSEYVALMELYGAGYWSGWIAGCFPGPPRSSHRADLCSHPMRLPMISPEAHARCPAMPTDGDGRAVGATEPRSSGYGRVRACVPTLAETRQTGYWVGL